jgi:hypothetical protein
MNKKTCITCKKEFSLDNFGKDKSRKDGYKYNCKICARLIQQNSRDKNPIKYKETSKQYYEKNKQHIFKKQYERNQSNPEKRKQYHDNWLKKNPEYYKQYKQKKRQIDLQYKIKCSLRERIRKALKNNFKTGKTIELLGCSIKEYIIYLEQQFDQNMTWENYGVYWEIDHIIQLHTFDLTNNKMQNQAFNFKNTRPLTISENRKRKKYE